MEQNTVKFSSENFLVLYVEVLPMRRSPPRPADLAFEQGVDYIDLAIDGLLSARLALVPEPQDWVPPDMALRAALEQDTEAHRGGRHLLEVEARLRELVSPDLAGYLNEWRAEWFDHTRRVAEVGWLVGFDAHQKRPGCARQNRPPATSARAGAHLA